MSASTGSKKQIDSNQRKSPSSRSYLGRLREQGMVTRYTYHARLDLLEKVRAYSYWERISISTLINQILEEFFEDKEIKPKPDRKQLHY